ncbi:MAG: HAMP domain-containing protein [Clostridia bacterium]|nr:HAMP domain-containing protein [Clostridia bacterium]
MVTISPTRTKRRFFGRIGFQISAVFLLLISLSFYITDIRLTDFVRDYLYQQRIRQDSLSLEKLAVTVAPLFQSVQSDRLDETLVSSAGEMGGRLMVLDTDGKVQFDSYAELMGLRLELPEVVSILTGSRTASYGIHTLGAIPGEDAGSRIAYGAVQIVGTEKPLGVLLYASGVNEMLKSLRDVERQLELVFIIVAAIALLAAVFFSNLITRPVNELSDTIQQMGKGDLSVRAKVKGTGEMRALAENYNMMAEQLESLDKSRNQFVSNASHELKTPLTTMKILLENVLYQPDMPVEMREEFLSDMNHEIDRLTNVVGDLLSLTQMDSRKMTVNMAWFDLSDTVANTLHLLRPQADKRAQELAAKITPGIMMYGDQAKLEQVVYNLTENALKYTFDGGRIVVSLQSKGKQAFLSVQDNGIGIPDQDIAHIFDRFYRVDKARSRETGGTGLGLSIVRQLVTMHGGEISVTSTPGKGSTFTVRLPLGEKGGAPA